MTSVLNLKKMKTIIIAAAIIISNNVSGQFTPPVNEPNYNMRKVFIAVPDSVNMDIALLTAILDRQAGEAVTIKSGTNIIMDGVLQSVTTKYNGVIKTALVSITGSDKILFSFARVMETVDKPVYRGYIIGKNTGDCFELIEKNGQYILVKKEINSHRAE